MRASLPPPDRPARPCRGPALLLAAVLAAVGAATVAGADPPDIGPGQIQRAIEKAAEFLIRQQKPDGFWEALHANDKRVGATGLVLLALANAGIDADHPAMRKGLTWLGEMLDPSVPVR